MAAEQVDAGEDWVSYRLPDGTEWRDGVAAAAPPDIVSLSTPVEFQASVAE